MSDPARRKEKQRQPHRAKNISPARIFAQAAERAMEVFTSTMSQEERTDFAAAHAQILLFATQFADGEAFADAIGITEDELE